MDSGSVIAIAAELLRVDFGVYSKLLVTAKVASFPGGAPGNEATVIKQVV